MPRIARLHVPGAIYHIMSRGIDGRAIFTDDNDRRVFLQMFAAELKRIGYHCYAWCLMSNHYHLLIRSNEQTIGKMMRRLNSGYARYYGNKYNRRGYLFQDRFKSIVTHDQRYVEEILRYVHLNPIRAGICSTIADLDRYPWTGHSVLMGNQNLGFQDTHSILHRFGKTSIAAREKYRLFIVEGMMNKSSDTLIETIRKSNKGSSSIHSIGSWVIGDQDFVQRALTADEASRIRIARYQSTGWDLETLAGYVADKMNVSKDSLLYKSKRTPQASARKAFCYLGYRILGFPATKIGRFLGISLPAVSFAVTTGELIVKKNGIKTDF